MAKALVISGDENTLYLYKIAIQYQKFVVETAANISQAAKRLSKIAPDLIVLDLKTINFEDLAQFDSVKKKVKKMPIIIMTELSAAEAKRQACVFEACQILAKNEATIGNLIKKTRQMVKK